MLSNHRRWGTQHTSLWRDVHFEQWSHLLQSSLSLHLLDLCLFAVDVRSNLNKSHPLVLSIIAPWCSRAQRVSQARIGRPFITEVAWISWTRTISSQQEFHWFGQQRMMYWLILSGIATCISGFGMQAYFLCVPFCERQTFHCSSAIASSQIDCPFFDNIVATCWVTHAI
jgi:hypothetical protein